MMERPMDKLLPPIEYDPNTFLRQHCKLPVLPALLNRIQGIISSDDMDIEKVAELISADPGLVAEVLKVVNSAYYGLPREIVDVRLAIAYLGLHEVHRLVLSQSAVSTPAMEDKDELNHLRFHSLYTALCTKYLCKKYEPQLSLEELWSAAILHDVGKLIYLEFFPDHYKALKRYSKELGCLFSEAERHFSLPSSSIFGTLLCYHWKLPDKIRDACESHGLKDLLNLESDNPSGPFTRMICSGNLMANLSNEELHDSTILEVVKAIRASLNLAESEFMAIMEDIKGFKGDVEKFNPE